jgi:hypothetical protein
MPDPVGPSTSIAAAPLGTVELCIARLARSRFALLSRPAAAHALVIALQAPRAAPSCLRHRFSNPPPTPTGPGLGSSRQAWYG